MYRLHVRQLTLTDTFYSIPDALFIMKSADKEGKIYVFRNCQSSNKCYSLLSFFILILDEKQANSRGFRLCKACGSRAGTPDI